MPLRVQILLRLRRGDPVEPVPAAGRADAGHGHPVRLRGADGVAHADGELSSGPRAAQPAVRAGPCRRHAVRHAHSRHAARRPRGRRRHPQPLPRQQQHPGRVTPARRRPGIPVNRVLMISAYTRDGRVCAGRSCGRGALYRVPGTATRRISVFVGNLL